MELLDHEVFMFSFGRFDQFGLTAPSHMVGALEAASSAPLPGPITEEVSLLSGTQNYRGASCILCFRCSMILPFYHTIQVCHKVFTLVIYDLPFLFYN